MKKLIISLIFAIAIIFASCTSLAFGVSGTYDSNDSYYIETSPYYHQRHYYADYYYDRHSSYYQKQHVNRNEPQRGRNKSNNRRK